MITLIVTVIWFCTIGIAARKILGIRDSVPPLDRFAFSFLLGMAVNGITLFVLGVAGVTIGTGAIVSVFAVALLVTVIPARRASGRAAPGYPLLPTVLLFIPFIAIAADAMWVPLRDYDGRGFWILKAKAIAHEEKIDGPFFQGTTSVNLHSEYPLLMPLNAATLMRAFTDDDDRRIRWLYALSALSLCLVVRSIVRAHSGAAAGAWCAAVLPWLPQISTELEGGALSASSDIPLAALVAAAFASVMRSDAGSKRDTGIWLAALVLIKSEGALIAMIIAVVAIAMRLRQRRVSFVRFLCMLLAPPAIAALLLGVWRARIPFEHGKDYGILIRTLPSKWTAIPDAAAALFGHALDFSHWGAFWIAVFLAALIVVIRRRSVEGYLALFLTAAILAPYVVAYTVTDWDLAVLAGTSANRLLTHVLAPATFLIAAAFWPREQSAPAPPGSAA